MKDTVLSLQIVENRLSPNVLCYVRSLYLASDSSLIDPVYL